MRQNYQPLNFFPVQCYSFSCDKSLLDTTLGIVKGLEYRSFNEPTGVLTSSDVQQKESFAPLMSWFQECIDTMHVDTGLNCDRLVVNKSWVNKSAAGSGHHHDAHRHPMSYYSGILYLTPGAPTIFIDPLFQREWGSFYLDGRVNTELAYHGGAGGLLLFPSYIIHATAPNTEDVDRYTMAFNTFPSGDINLGGHGLPMARVKTEGWKDLGPLNLDEYARD